ncbi:MAG TPA: TerD family protein, partial [Longimicrobium sp.]
MTRFTRGQKGKLGDITPRTDISVRIALDAPGLTLDVSCFGVDAQGKLSDDRYFSFFNQLTTPRREIVFDPARGTFDIALDQLPATIDRLVFTAAIDGAGTMAALRGGSLTVAPRDGAPALEFPFAGSDFQSERAIIVAEIYRKDVWRFAAVGQGFAGGLKALLEHFGGQALEEAAPPPPPPPAAPAASPQRLSLEKKMAEKAPQLLSLAKKAQLTLEKKGLSSHRARVGLVLDISASMTALYREGKVQLLAERVLALATRFDD